MSLNNKKIICSYSLNYGDIWNCIANPFSCRYIDVMNIRQYINSVCGLNMRNINLRIKFKNYLVFREVMIRQQRLEKKLNDQELHQAR